MKFLVIGCGSIGERHINNLKALGVDVCISDIDRPTQIKVSQELNLPIFYSSSEGLKYIDAVVICTTPNSHISLARSAIRWHKPVFIEKPISDTLDGVDDLLQEAAEKNLVVSVGYQLRFNKSLQEFKKLLGTITPITAMLEFSQFIGDWRPEQDYRSSYTADLGIILDGSHEIHFAMWLFGNAKQVRCSTKNILNLKGEDIADIKLEFENELKVDIRLDMVKKGYYRGCHVEANSGGYNWNYQKNNDDYIAEMQHFINCIEGKEKPLVDGYIAKEVLRVALAAKESNGKWINL